MRKVVKMLLVPATFAVVAGAGIATTVAPAKADLVLSPYFPFIFITPSYPPPAYYAPPTYYYPPPSRYYAPPSHYYAPRPYWYSQTCYWDAYYGRVCY